MIKELLILVFISVLPLLELRLAIPVGILSGSVILPFGVLFSGFSMQPLLVFLIVVITNTLLGIFLFNVFKHLDYFFRKSKISKGYSKFLDKNRKKVKKYVDKYGLLGLIMFISIPLPGSGVYAGMFGAFAIGMKKEQVYLANMIGVTISAIIVTFLILAGDMVF